MAIGNFQVTENHSDALFPASPVVVINLNDSGTRAMFRIYYPQCGL